MKWLLKLSLYHPNLIKAEIRSLLHPLHIKWLFPSIAILESDTTSIQKVIKYSAMIKFILQEPIIIHYSDLADFANSDYLKNKRIIAPINELKTFKVRHDYLGDHESKLSSEEIERRVGSWIQSQYPNLSVNLSNAANLLQIYSWEKQSAMGWVYYKSDFSVINQRAPKFSPYFRGGMMKPRLSRLLVNLLQPLDAVIFDPFCGHGGLLREIAEMGNFGVGIEISKKICRELLANNRYFSLDHAIAIIMGDALNPPIRKYSFSQVVTDPPYAIQTTTKGIGRDNLMRIWLERQKHITEIVFATPTDMLKNLPDKWNIIIDAEDFVHKSLVRRIRKVKLELMV